MKKILLLVLSLCVVCISCSKKADSNEKNVKIQNGESVEVNSSNETVIISNDTKSITITGNNNTVSTENSSDNTNNSN